MGANQLGGEAAKKNDLNTWLKLHKEARMTRQRRGLVLTLVLGGVAAALDL